MKTLMIITCLLFAFPSVAEESEPQLLDTLTKMRLRQEGEEQRLLRVVQPPQVIEQSFACTEVQMTRQRLRDVGKKKEAGTTTFESVNIDAGHESVTIDNNQGTVNNNVSVELKESEHAKRCL